MAETVTEPASLDVAPIDATTAATLDTTVAALRANALSWVRRPVPQKVDWLLDGRARLGRVAERWVRESAAAKGLDPASPWVGEEWMSGPWALAAGITGLVDTLRAVAGGRQPAFPGLRTLADGRLAVPVFPRSIFDRLLLSGIRAEVWMQPGVTEANLDRHMATFYREAATEGRVALVLGAGNINSIAPLDALYRLFAHGQVVLLKLNPVNEYMAPVLADALAPFIDGGALRIVSGGAAIGSYLAHHPGIDEVHITGSARTHDAIVFGPGPEGEQRRRHRQPLLAKPISSELGGVGPAIVVPGPWSRADLRYQAENLATMKLHNAGCNCVAAQVLVLPRQWELRDALLAEVRRIFSELPPRRAYYPGAAQRWQHAIEAHPEAERFGGDVPRTLIAGLDPLRDREICFDTEFFGAVFAETSLPAADAASFLDTAVDFCNARLDGSLGASILVHPHTARELGNRLEHAVGRLRYGSVGINVWNACAFLLAQCPWGAYPGHPLEQVSSGRGVVHNSFLLDRVEKTVIRGSFYPFPRSWAHGDASLLPRPPWFVTNRTAATTARRVAFFAVDPGWRHIPGIFLSALRG
jgi:aldehyde dehydrogenase (NAD(P)+)